MRLTWIVLHRNVVSERAEWAEAVFAAGGRSAAVTVRALSLSSSSALSPAETAPPCMSAWLPRSVHRRRPRVPRYTAMPGDKVFVKGISDTVHNIDCVRLVRHDHELGFDDSELGFDVVVCGYDQYMPEDKVAAYDDIFQLKDGRIVDTFGCLADDASDDEDPSTPPPSPTPTTARTPPPQRRTPPKRQRGRPRIRRQCVDGGFDYENWCTPCQYGRDKLDGKFKHRCRGPRLIPPFSCADADADLTGVVDTAGTWASPTAPGLLLNRFVVDSGKWGFVRSYNNPFFTIHFDDGDHWTHLIVWGDLPEGRSHQDHGGRRARGAAVNYGTTTAALDCCAGPHPARDLLRDGKRPVWTRTRSVNSTRLFPFTHAPVSSMYRYARSARPRDGARVRSG